MISTRWLIHLLSFAGLLRSCYTYCPLPLRPHHRSATTWKSANLDTKLQQTYSVEGSLSSFRLAWIKALRGDVNALSTFMPGGLKWSNPVLQGSTEKDFKDAMSQFAGFFIDPTVQFFETKIIDDTTISISYQLSFWYPIPWRPRIIIPGKVTLKAKTPNFTEIVNVVENWDISLADIYIKQALPRFWDFWHSFTSPTPEYPPVKILGTDGKVQLVELPETLVIEIQWTGLAEFPGPPLLSIPGFALFGMLKTARRSRDPYYTVMPVEVQSGKYTDAQGREMKKSIWIFHVPTFLQEIVLEHVKSKKKFTINPTSLLSAAIDVNDAQEEDLGVQVDYQVGLENANVMLSISGGKERGQNVEFDEKLMKTFESSERIEYMFKHVPKRKISLVDIKGDPSPESISKAVSDIKDSLSSGRGQISRNILKPKILDVDCSRGEKSDSAPKIGFLLKSCKAGFNSEAQPSIAVYELQYGYKTTSVFLELEE